MTASIDAIRRLADAGGHRFEPPSSRRLPLVAFAGGTGSGKSSLVNAVAGDEVSLVGELRPTTSEAVAVFPERAASTASTELDRLGVIRRVAGRHRGAVLVDLPDLDSVVEGHRRLAEAVLAHADAVVWVVDPEKYADAVLHETIERFSDIPAIVVCNHADRLPGHERLEVLEDLARLVGDRDVIPTAVPPHGGSVGVDSVAAWVGEVDAEALDRPTRLLARRWVVAAGTPHEPPAVEAWGAVETGVGAFVEACAERAAGRLADAGRRRALLGSRPAPAEPTTPPDLASPPPSWPPGPSAVGDVVRAWGPAAARVADAADAVALMADSASLRAPRWWLAARWATVPVLAAGVAAAVVVDWWWAAVAGALALAIVVALGVSGRRAGRDAAARIHGEVDVLWASALAAEPVVTVRERCRLADDLAAAAAEVTALGLV